MHVPDGYLSPLTCGVGYVAATPFWLVASARVKKAVGGRTVPLLAVFSAFTFTIMMFNVPVPGGTTAHAVGATLVAIVLGPWAAVLSTSVALIIQALFFGDGGVTAIGVNCFNMAVALPLTGYLTYRLIAGRSDMLSQRRVVAAAAGSYIGISVAALLVGVELGLQPHIASTNGIPNYSPYGFGAAVPSMLVAYVFGASFVEACVTALGLAYLQKSFPEILARGQPKIVRMRASKRVVSPWIAVAGLTGIAVTALFLAGLLAGHGRLDRWAGLDWAIASWNGVAQTVIVSAAVSALALPTLYLLLRKATSTPRAIVMVLAALLIWAPVGLIAPGDAFGEEASASQAEVTAALAARAQGDAGLFDALPAVNRQCACVPSGMADGGPAGHALFASYRPPWISDSDAAWRQAVGYQIAGLAGIGLLALLGFSAMKFGRWLLPGPPPDWRNAEE
ncbi:MAG: cobalt transporter CbiM [Dehalococcoidia bacterium]|jgi:cobalt/nickel transport system permease protein